MEVGSSSVDGVAYDHVISVEVDDRQQPLKLGVNRGDNPYTLADRFIEKHDLPPGYREQIVQYILQNTGASTRDPGAEVVNTDPFTGGNAYVPGSGPAFPRSAGGGPPTGPATGGGVDPFTGSGSQQTSLSHVPAGTMLVFDTLPNPSAVANKIRALSAKLAEVDFSQQESLLLSDEEAAPGGPLDKLLAGAAAAAGGGIGFGEQETALLNKLLRWPAFALFPALDVTRMAILHEPTASRLASAAGPLELSPLGNLGAALATACAEPQLPGNQQTGLRLLCNVFKSPSLRGWLRAQAAALLDGFSPAFGASAKAVRGAGAAFLLNLAILIRSEALGADIEAQTVSAVVGLLSSAPQEDEDAQFRAVVALGTILSGAKREEVRQIAAALEVKALLTKLLQSRGYGKVREAAKQVLTLL